MLKIVFAACLLIGIPSFAAASGCSDLLPYARGVQILVKSGQRDEQSASALTSLLKQMNLDETTKSAAASGSYGVASGSANYDELRRAITQSEALATSNGEQSKSAQDFLYKFAENLPSYAATAFQECETSKGPRYTIAIDPDGVDVTFKIDLTSPAHDSPSLIINSVALGNISCPSLVVGATVQTDTSMVFGCTRSNGAGGQISIGSNYVNGDSGANTLTIPAMHVSKAHIEERTVPLHFCPTPGCAPASQIFAFNVTPDPLSCTEFDESKVQLVHGKEQLAAFSEVKIDQVSQLGSIGFSAIHFRPAMVISAHEISVCGYRDGPFENYPGIDLTYLMRYKVFIPD